jgi:hypothetical protein
MRVLVLLFTRSDRLLESSHRVAKNKLRGDDYIRRAGPLGASRGTVHHSMNMGVAATTTLDTTYRIIA